MCRSFLNKEWQLTATAATIAFALGANASAAEQGSFPNRENDALEWGVSVLASTPVRITHSTKDTYEIVGGTDTAIETLADEGTEGWVENSGPGSVLIQAGTGGAAYGIENVASGAGSKGTISNETGGTLTIRGGSDERSYGIWRNSHSSGSSGTISNKSTGSLIIEGGENGSGIEQNAVSYGSGEIVNAGSGSLTIQAGHAPGLRVNAYEGGVGLVANEAEGDLLIAGGSKSSAIGIHMNACFGDSEGSIVNKGTGTLSIKGGSGTGAYGLGYNGTQRGIGTIANEGSGTLTIQAGSGEGAYGLYCNGGSDGKGYITNSVYGTINLLGNAEVGTFAVMMMAEETGDTGVLDNAGVMNLNAYAIADIDGNSVWSSPEALVINRSTGTVNAEVQAIFEKSESTSSEDFAVAILNPESGSTGETTIEGFGSGSSAIAWNLKDDWAAHSQWEDGGTLNVSDVVEGSLAAQQISKAFTSRFGTGTILYFLGEDDWASEGLGSGSEFEAFTADIGNALIDQGYAGNIVTNFNLNNASVDGAAQALTIGTGTGEVIKDSIGFRKIEGVSSVTVNSGKYFALVGLPAGGELIKGGAPVTLDNGTLKLGVAVAESARTDSSTSGTLETITMKNGSKIETENMWVQAESIKGAGTVSLTDTGRMHVKEMTISGDIRNQGTLSADTLTISKGSAVSSKTLKSSGKITVESTASLSADGIVAADSFDIRGVVKLGKNAAVYTGAAALEQMRKDHADAAVELDRVEGKAEVSTMSVLDRIVAESMKTSGEAEGTEQGKGGERATFVSDKESEAVVFTGGASKPKVKPSAAQAFAAFDAVNRIAGEIESGAAPDRHGLWVKLQANDGRFDVVEGGSSFDVDTEGAVVGAEAAVAVGVKLGAAVSYLDGEIDASGLKNNWTSWGLHLYGAYRADAFSLKGTVGWLRGTTEAEKDLDADVWHAGLRAEYGMPTGAMTVTPFMGARVMSGSFDGLESQTVFSIPLGAKLSGTIEAGGWILTPALEAAYVRSMGDTEAEDVRFVPKDALKGSIGLKAAKGMWTGELSYVGATGSNGYRSNSLNVKLGLMF